MQLNWPDEFKADVYAQLEEQLKPDMTYAETVGVVERAIHSTYHAIAHG